MRLAGTPWARAPTVRCAVSATKLRRVGRGTVDDTQLGGLIVHVAGVDARGVVGVPCASIESGCPVGMALRASPAVRTGPLFRSVDRHAQARDRLGAESERPGHRRTRGRERSTPRVRSLATPPPHTARSAADRGQLPDGGRARAAVPAPDGACGADGAALHAALRPSRGERRRRARHAPSSCPSVQPRLPSRTWTGATRHDTTPNVAKANPRASSWAMYSAIVAGVASAARLSPRMSDHVSKLRQSASYASRGARGKLPPGPAEPAPALVDRAATDTELEYADGRANKLHLHAGIARLRMRRRSGGTYRGERRRYGSRAHTRTKPTSR